MHPHTFHSLRPVWYPPYLFTSRTSESGDPFVIHSRNGAVFGTAGLLSTLRKDPAVGASCAIVHSATSSRRFMRRRIINNINSGEDA